MELKGFGGITPMLLLNGGGEITARNLAAECRLPTLSTGVYPAVEIVCPPATFSDATVGDRARCDDVHHVVRLICGGAEWFAYRPSSDYLLFPALMRMGGRMLSEGFITCIEAIHHAKMLERLAALSHKASWQGEYSPSIERLGDALVKLCFLLTLEIRREELFDALTLVETQRDRLMALFARFGCTLKIDTSELNMHELYPVRPLIWLTLLFRTAVLLLYASVNERLLIRVSACEGNLSVELIGDSSLGELFILAPLELTFNSLFCERIGVEMTIGEEIRGTCICMSQKLSRDCGLALHALTPIERERLEALLAEYDAAFGL